MATLVVLGLYRMVYRWLPQSFRFLTKVRCRCTGYHQLCVHFSSRLGVQQYIEAERRQGIHRPKLPSYLSKHVAGFLLSILLPPRSSLDGHQARVKHRMDPQVQLQSV